MNSARITDVNIYIQQKGEVKFTELEEIFSDVSSMTLRRDLQKLEEQGHIIRVRGGARSITSLPDTSESVYTHREKENLAQKEEIAKKAVKLLETGRSIFFDSGTTMMSFAKVVPNNNYLIITSGPNIGLELSFRSNIQVNITGGMLNKNTLSLSGSNSLALLENINIDIAFMGTSGFTLENGFTSGNINEYELKKYIIKKARKVIILMDRDKVGRTMPYTFAKLSDIDVLVTDSGIATEIKKCVDEYGIELI